MSAELRMFPAGAAEGFGGVDPRSSPPAEMETLRMFVNERLTAAVDDILGLFGETVARYREQIDRQRGQLDKLRYEEDKWSQADPEQTSCSVKLCPDDPIRSVPLDRTGETDAGFSAARNKTEVGDEDCGASEPTSDLDPAGSSEAASDGRHLTESSYTEDRGDWGEAPGLWRPEETEEEAPGQNSTLGGKARVSARSAAHTRLSRDTPFHCSVCGQSFTLRSCYFKSKEEKKTWYWHRFVLPELVLGSTGLVSTTPVQMVVVMHLKL
ncbi:uncharacterized protein LOC114568460 [Perca flavescens]|uniref:uncharacterized protein LOC114568460 n=1 Tax=Perca flavescens TaxID=8167 RepID=UPI00106E75D3|nr:uncharacterized protein LOC114568460 [Perca flavescens]